MMCEGLDRVFGTSIADVVAVVVQSLGVPGINLWKSYSREYSGKLQFESNFKGSLSLGLGFFESVCGGH
jgi:hypothetical protein